MATPRSRSERLARERWTKIVVLYLVVTAMVTFLLWRASDNVTDQLRDHQHRIEEQQEQLAIAVLERCRISNDGRAEVNRRGEITKEFLLTAAEARRATALGSDEAWERISNTKTAKRYVILAAKIKPLEYNDCDLNGEPDLP